MGTDLKKYIWRKTETVLTVLRVADQDEVQVM